MAFLFRKRLLTTSLLIAASSLATPALAQDAANNAQSDEPALQSSESVQAQNTGAEEPTEVTVTGTLIRNPNIVSSSPVSVISSQEVELRSSNTAEQFLRELPGAVPGIGSAVNNGNAGASTVNLRGLGDNRNIVLLDGQRMVPSGLSGVVDLNNIPLALIERTDVLTGGASTTYGADAVAGVVNFITRSDFSGIDLTATNQITERGDGKYFRADLTVGGNFADDRGNAVVSIGYQSSDPVYQGQREFGSVAISSYSGEPSGSGTAVPGRFSLPGVGTRQIDPATGALVPTYQLFNFNPYNIYQTPFERVNMYGAARFEISPQAEVYTQALFSKNKVSTIIAPSGTFNLPLEIPYSNPYLPAAARAQFCAANGVSAADCAVAASVTDPTAPGYRTFTTVAARRFTEAGNRFSEYTTQLFQVRGGVRGELGGSWNYDVFGAYGESENTQRQSGNGLYSRLRQASLATSTTTCLDESNGCVPINLFGPEGSITSEQLGFLTGVTTSGSTMTSLGTLRGVVSGDLGFSSPFADAPISLALGGEYRKNTASTTSDLATQTPDEVLGNGAAAPDTNGQISVKEVFGELIAPLVSERPFFQSLTLELGARYSDYSTTGGNFTWKAGGSWELFDAFKIRGNYNKAVRSPNIDELFSPSIVALGNLAVDPCSGTAPVGNANLTAVCLAQGAPLGTIGSIDNPSAGQPNTTISGNRNLDVETAKTWTVGAVVQPMKNLTITADYYNIKINNAITQPSIGDVLGACFDNITAASATSLACTQIRRSSITGGLDGSAATTPGIPLVQTNSGRLFTDGIDVTASYRQDLGFASLNLSFLGNWTSRSKFQANPGALDRDCVGFYSVNCASIQPEFSFNQRSTLSFDDVDLSLLWRFISPTSFEPAAYEDDLAAAIGAGPGDCPDPAGADEGGCVVNSEFRRIKAYHYFDLSARFQATDNFTLTVVARNLFNRKPPVVGSDLGDTAFNSGNTYPSTYDALGRLYSVTARVTF
jgi:outer membrane receptor protein involved in Fe transport